MFVVAMRCNEVLSVYLECAGPQDAAGNHQNVLGQRQSLAVTADRNSCTCKSDCRAQQCWQRSCRTVAALPLRAAANAKRNIAVATGRACNSAGGMGMLSAEIWRNRMTRSYSETVTVSGAGHRTKQKSGAQQLAASVDGDFLSVYAT
jgi:hypothetical protein